MAGVPRLRRIPLLLLALAVPLAAWANGVALPDTLNVALRPGDPVEVGLEANFGWLSAEDGVTFTWVCHEVVLDPTSSLTPYFFPGQNVTLASVRSLGVSVDPNDEPHRQNPVHPVLRDPTFSLFRSADGCEWDAPADLDGVNVREVAFDPDTPDHVLAATFTGSGAKNGIWESDDSGATWHRTTLAVDNRFFRSVEFSVANPLRAYATASWFQPVPSAYLYVSDDGGDVWSEIPWTFMVGGTLQSNVDIVATSPSDANIAYARTNGGTDYLLRTTNGGMAWETVLSVVDDIRGVVFEPDTGAVWAATAFQGTFRATDGRTFAPIAGAPKIRGLGADARGVFAAANNYEDGFAIGVTTNGGASFAGLTQFVDVAGTRPCPAGSDVATICEPLWPALAQLLGITSPTPTPSPTTSGGGGDDKPWWSCSLATGGAAMAPACAVMLLLAIAALRRSAFRAP